MRIRRISRPALGVSGDTGNSSSPHLHFDVTQVYCGLYFFGDSCQTVPLSIRNASPPADRLEAGWAYIASVWD